MPSPPTDADLLRPSLDKRHDLRGVRSPWDPSNVVLASFFAGPFGAALLLFLNQKRLRLGGFLWALPLLAYLVSWLPFAWYMATEEPIDSWPISDHAFRILVRVLWVGLAWVAARPQRSLFRIHVHQDGEPGKLLLPALGAILFNWGVVRGLGLALTAIVLGGME